MVAVEVGPEVYYKAPRAPAEQSHYRSVWGATVGLPPAVLGTQGSLVAILRWERSRLRAGEAVERTTTGLLPQEVLAVVVE